MSRYELTQFAAKKGEPCSHPQLIPGLDASICPVCEAVYATPIKAVTYMPQTLETKDLPSLATPPIPAFEYAITLHRPWPYAIAHMGKDIENRTWKATLKPNDWLAIHAGRSYDFAAEDWLLERFPKHKLPEITEHATGIVAIAQFLGNVTQSKSVWFGGPVGWRLGKVLPLIDAVPCSGKQGLWKPGQAIKTAVYEALKVPF